MSGLICYFCGWSQHHVDEGWCSLHDEEYDLESILSYPNLDDASSPFEELSAHLSQHRSGGFNLERTQLKELVAAVYRNAGFQVVLASQAKDADRNLILLRRDHSDYAMVEIVHHRNRGGVNLVRQLQGVHLPEEAPPAILFSVSGPSANAEEKKSTADPKRTSCTFELAILSNLLNEAGLTQEPLGTTIERDPDRSRYRNWFVEQFDRPLDPLQSGNPSVQGGGPKTLIM